MKKVTYGLVIFFILVNSQFLHPADFEYPFLFFLFLFLFWIVLAISVIIQFIYILKEGFKLKKHLLPLGIALFVLTSAVYFPFGFIRKEVFEPPLALLASREGSANCTTTLKLFEYQEFTQSTFCFGKKVNQGTYHQRNDTVFFEFAKNDSSLYDFGTIEMLDYDGPHKLLGTLYLYKNDSLVNLLGITQNNF